MCCLSYIKVTWAKNKQTNENYRFKINKEINPMLQKWNEWINELAHLLLYFLFYACIYFHKDLFI